MKKEFYISTGISLLVIVLSWVYGVNSFKSALEVEVRNLKVDNLRMEHNIERLQDRIDWLINGYQGPLQPDGE